MNQKFKRFFNSTGAALSASPLVLGLSVGNLMAQETSGESSSGPDFSSWTCRRCPDVEEGWQGLAAFGLGWISDDSLRYGNYRGLEDEGVYVPMDGEASYRDLQGRWVEISIENLDLNSRQIEMEGGREGAYKVRLSWQEIPTYRGYGAQTPYLGQGGETLTLPADWVAGRTTQDMTALQGSLQAAPMKLQRKIMDAGATIRFGGDWSVNVDVSRQEKKGTRPFGGAGIFYNNATQILAPVDFTTDRADLGINWNRKTFQLSLGFMASEFDNGRQSLTWDNPFRATPELQQFRSALEPSNESFLFSLAGAWTITPGLHLSGYASTGEMSQDEAFLPYSINPDFGDLLLPRTSLGGKIDTRVANLGGKFFARINSRLSFTATARHDERDNRTPVNLYTPVLMDFIPFTERENRPYGFERTQYAADFRFRAFRKLRLGAGGRYQELDRTLQAVENSEEKTLWGEAKWTPTARTHLRFKYEESERDTSEYQVIDDSGRVDHPLFRKFNQADRDRSRMQMEGFVSLVDGLGLNLSVYGAEDEYENSALGLQDSEVSGATFSVDYAFSATTSVYGFVSSESIESELFGIEGSQQWSGLTEDRISTSGAGFSTAIASDKRLGIDLVWAGSDGEIDIIRGDETPFPNLDTTLFNVRLNFSHDVSDQWGYQVYAEYENFDSSDWAFDGIGVDGVDAVLTYGLISPKYDVINLRAQAVYRF